MGRFFVAAIPPVAVVDRLDLLDRTDGGAVRWVRPRQWHVTLRFLGDVDRAAAVSALDRLDHPVVAAGLGPAVTWLGERVICVPVQGVDALATAVVEATAHLEAPPPHDPFTGHLTLGRTRRSGVGSEVVGTPVSARFAVDEVALVESHVGAGPTRHDIVHRVRLERSPA